MDDKKIKAISTSIYTEAAIRMVAAAEWYKLTGENHPEVAAFSGPTPLNEGLGRQNNEL